LDALTCASSADAPQGALALEAEGRSFPRDELARRARFVADAVLAEAGNPAEIAFVASASSSTIALIWGLLDRGRALVPVHPRFGAAERAKVLATAGDPAFVPPEALESLWHASSRAAKHHPGPPSARRVEPDALTAVLFTSGTTATPRAVELTRAAFVASAYAHAANLPFESHDRWLVAMPLAHAGGLSIVTRCLVASRPIVLLPRFDPDEVLDAIVRHRATLLSVVPTMLAALVERDRRGALATLRAILVGGAEFPRALRDEALGRGLPTLATYGLTETCSQIATESPRDPKRPGERHSGRPLHGVEVRIERASGDAALPCEPGRVLVRGPMRMRGLRGGVPLAPDAWLDTRDAGYLDEHGRLVVLGRVDDTIVTGGENVHPTEIEEALRDAGAADAVVFAVDDERFGKIVAAALVLAPRGVDASAVLARAEAALASFKRPRRFVVVDAMPRNATGKIDRRAAARAFASSLAPTPARPAR